MDVQDELLLESVERYGREWRKIQEKHYSTRSANDLKNRLVSFFNYAGLC